MSVKYCLPVPVYHFRLKLMHPAARSLCDSWAIHALVLICNNANATFSWLQQTIVFVPELKYGRQLQGHSMWQTRLRACVRAKGQHFEQFLLYFTFNTAHQVTGYCILSRLPSPLCPEPVVCCCILTVRFIVFCKWYNNMDADARLKSSLQTLLGPHYDSLIHCLAWLAGNAVD